MCHEQETQPAATCARWAAIVLLHCCREWTLQEQPKYHNYIINSIIIVIIKFYCITACLGLVVLKFKGGSFIVAHKLHPGTAVYNILVMTPIAQLAPGTA